MPKFHSESVLHKLAELLRISGNAIRHNFYIKIKSPLFVINEKISVVRDCNGLKAGDLITHVKITDGSAVVEDMDVTRLAEGAAFLIGNFNLIRLNAY